MRSLRGFVLADKLVDDGCAESRIKANMIANHSEAADIDCFLR